MLQKIIGWTAIMIVTALLIVSGSWQLATFNVDVSAFNSGHSSLSWDQQGAGSFSKYLWCSVVLYTYIASITVIYFSLIFKK